MIIKSVDGNKYIDMGTKEVFFALYSTIVVRLEKKKSVINNAIEFMKKGKISSECCLDVAREFNLVRDYLSSVEVKDMVYDMRDLDKKAPWINNISPVVTSCSNMFVTKDGKDALYEIVALLTYAYYQKVDVIIE